MTYSLARAIALVGLYGLAGCSEAAAPASAGATGGSSGSGGSSTAGMAGLAAGGSATVGGAAGSAGSAGSAMAGAGSGGGGAGGLSGGAGGSAGSGGGGQLDPNAPEPSSGCGSADAPDDGNTELVVGDLTRSYVLRKPASYDAKKPWRLLLALHPNGSSSSYWDGTNGERAFRPLVADEAVLVLPQARDNDWRGDVPLDLSYFDALIERLETTLCIDKKRIVAAGFSGGGSFSGALGCYRTDIRAIAVGGAVSYFEEQDCVGKPAAWITIGDQEAIQSRLDFRDYWRSYAGCEATGSVGAPATCTAYDCPDPARPVEFCSHPGDHVWPSFGTEAAWAFLSSF